MATESRWRTRSREVIVDTLVAMPDADRKTQLAAIAAAYPFGERKHLPYRMWLEAVREVMGPSRKAQRIPAWYPLRWPKEKSFIEAWAESQAEELFRNGVSFRSLGPYADWLMEHDDPRGEPWAQLALCEYVPIQETKKRWHWKPLAAAGLRMVAKHELPRSIYSQLTGHQRMRYERLPGSVIVSHKSVVAIEYHSPLAAACDFVLASVMAANTPT